MNLWTTFTPRKVVWELTFIKTKGNAPSYDWLENLDIIFFSLRGLKSAGIAGIRLVIYPSEITNDGKEFKWRPIETMLDLCSQEGLAVDLCIGPYQYPNYPGIYLPTELIKQLNSDLRQIDENPFFYNYGLEFLKKQIARFGDDKRVSGFHLANEWPDRQKVEGKRELKTGVSIKFMLDAAGLLKSMTRKPISLNTNINIYDFKKINSVFGDMLMILSKQGKLGFDIYPTQDKWKKNPLQSMRNKITNFPKAFKKLQSNYPETEIYFAEIEAQPWGSGQSWYRMISVEETPGVKVLNYFNDSLEKTFEKYILGSGCKTVSLWGCDFWLAAEMMGTLWPIKNIRDLSKE